MDATSQAGQARGWYRFLVGSLVFFFVIHIVALPTMGLIIQPGFDLAIPSTERAEHVATNAWWWRLGWLPWQLSAVSDLIVTGALLGWICRIGSRSAMRWALLAALFNLIAVVPEQLYEWRLITAHVDLAERALSDSTALADFESEQRAALVVTSIWSAGFYLLMTFAWHRALTQLVGIRRWFAGFIGRVLAVCTIGLAIASILLAVQVWNGLAAGVPIAMAAGTGFIAACVWSLAAIDVAGRAHHRRGADDHLHRLRWPDHGPLRGLAAIGNSRGLRDAARIVPFLTLKSDIEDVVYLNWLVPTAVAQQIIPDPLVCDDRDGLTAVSVLTYRHGAFGPAIYGPIRRLLPSPLQSNWRLYPVPVQPGEPDDAIWFFKTVLSMWPHVASSRLIADGLPAHYPASFSHDRNGQTITSAVDPGAGSAPGLRSQVTEIAEITEMTELTERTERRLPEAWASRFASWNDAAEWLVDQNRGLQVMTNGDVSESRIEIPINIADLRPATVDALAMHGIPEDLIIDASDPTLFAFVVPTVSFKATGERTALAAQPPLR